MPNTVPNQFDPDEFLKKFDPDAFLAKQEGNGFDPDAFIAKFDPDAFLAANEGEQSGVPKRFTMEGDKPAGPDLTTQAGGEQYVRTYFHGPDEAKTRESHVRDIRMFRTGTERELEEQVALFPSYTPEQKKIAQRYIEQLQKDVKKYDELETQNLEELADIDPWKRLIVNPIKAGYIGLVRNVADLYGMAIDVAETAGLKEVPVGVTGYPIKLIKPGAEKFAKTAEKIQEKTEEFAPRGGVRGFVADMMRAVPSLHASIAAYMAGAGAAGVGVGRYRVGAEAAKQVAEKLTWTTAFTMEAGSAYADLKKRGSFDPVKDVPIATAVGIVNAFLEKSGAKSVLRNIPLPRSVREAIGKKMVQSGLLGRIVSSGWGEGKEEFWQEVTQEIGEYLSDPEVRAAAGRDYPEYFKESLKRALYSGAVGFGLGGGVTAAAGRRAEERGAEKLPPGVGAIPPVQEGEVKGLLPPARTEVPEITIRQIRPPAGLLPAAGETERILAPEAGPAELPSTGPTGEGGSAVVPGIMPYESPWVKRPVSDGRWGAPSATQPQYPALEPVIFSSGIRKDVAEKGLREVAPMTVNTPVSSFVRNEQLAPTGQMEIFGPVLTEAQMRQALRPELGDDVDRMKGQDLQRAWAGLDPELEADLDRQSRMRRIAEAAPTPPIVTPENTKAAYDGGSINYKGSVNLGTPIEPQYAHQFDDPLTRSTLYVRGDVLTEDMVKEAIAQSREKGWPEVRALVDAGMSIDEAKYASYEQAQQYLKKNLPQGDQEARRYFGEPLYQALLLPIKITKALDPIINEARAQASRDLRAGKITPAEFKANVHANLMRMVVADDKLKRHRLRIESQLSRIDADPQRRIRVFHYSREPRPTLSKKYAGTGRAGEGRWRGDKVLHFYLGPRQIEPQFLGMVKHEANVKGVFLDVNSGMGERVKRAVAKRNSGAVPMDAFIREVKRMGFDGLYNSEYTGATGASLQYWGADVSPYLINGEPNTQYVEQNYSTPEHAERIEEIAVENPNGVTIDPRYGTKVKASDLGNETHLVAMGRDYAEFVKGETVNDLDREEIRDAVARMLTRHRNIFLKHPEFYLGTWFSTERGGLVIDISRRTTPEFAEEAGLWLDQMSVANLKEIDRRNWEKAFIETNGKDDLEWFKRMPVDPAKRWEWVKEKSAGNVVDLANLKRPFNSSQLKSNEEVARVFAGAVVRAGVEKLDSGPLGLKYGRIKNSLVKNFTDIAANDLHFGMDWYTEDVNRAMDVLAEQRPELADPTNRRIFMVMTAITSSQADPTLNFQRAISLWDYFNTEGKLPELADITPDMREAGVNSEMILALDMFQKIANDHGGYEGALKWLNDRHSMQDLLKYHKAQAPPFEYHGAGEKTEGAFLLGPKRGAFFLNLDGRDDIFTYDTWEHRLASMFLGTLLNPNGSLSGLGSVASNGKASERRIIIKAFNDAARELGLTHREFQAATWAYIKTLWGQYGGDSGKGSFSEAASEAVRRREAQESDIELFGPTPGRGVEAGEAGPAPAVEPTRGRAGEAPAEGVREGGKPESIGTYVHLPLYQEGKAAGEEALRSTSEKIVREGLRRSKTGPVLGRTVEEAERIGGYEGRPVVVFRGTPEQQVGADLSFGNEVSPRDILGVVTPKKGQSLSEAVKGVREGGKTEGVVRFSAFPGLSELNVAISQLARGAEIAFYWNKKDGLQTGKPKESHLKAFGKNSGALAKGGLVGRFDEGGKVVALWDDYGDTPQQVISDALFDLVQQGKIKKDALVYWADGTNMRVKDAIAGGGGETEGVVRSSAIPLPKTLERVKKLIEQHGGTIDYDGYTVYADLPEEGDVVWAASGGKTLSAVTATDYARFVKDGAKDLEERVRMGTDTETSAGADETEGVDKAILADPFFAAAAIRYLGKVYQAEKGRIHADVADQIHLEEGASYEDLEVKGDDGFVGQDGKFYTRGEAEKIVKERTGHPWRGETVNLLVAGELEGRESTRWKWIDFEDVDKLAKKAGKDKFVSMSLMPGLEPAAKMIRDAVGSDVTPVVVTYDEAAETVKGKDKNIWIRQSSQPDNSKRTLLVQISSKLMLGEATKDISERYYDKLYEKRDGYDRTDDFWEIPFWIAQVGTVDVNSDVYVVRSMDEAKEFLKKANYKNVAFSALDINTPYIKELVAANPTTQAFIGGYVNDLKTAFDGIENVTTVDTVEEFANLVGVKWEPSYNYRHFMGTKVIPRLTMSKGCRYVCAFCTVPKKVTSLSKEVIDRQVESMKDLNVKLVYLDDKTFGQADNYQYLSELYTRLKDAIPDFQGFIVQTTAPDLVKMPMDWLKKSGIKYVEIGVETYNDAFLKSTHKPARESTIDAATQKLREAKIALIPNIIIGMKGKDAQGNLWEETAETYQRTMDYLERNADVISHVNAYNLAVYEGTELANQVDAKISADMNNENLLSVQAYQNPAVHQHFHDWVVEYGMRQLDKQPFVGARLDLGLGKILAAIKPVEKFSILSFDEDVVAKALGMGATPEQVLDRLTPAQQKKFESTLNRPIEPIIDQAADYWERWKNNETPESIDAPIPLRWGLIADKVQSLYWMKQADALKAAGFKSLDLLPGSSYHMYWDNALLRKDESGRYKITPADLVRAFSDSQKHSLNAWAQSRENQDRVQESIYSSINILQGLSSGWRKVFASFLGKGSARVEQNERAREIARKLGVKPPPPTMTRSAREYYAIQYVTQRMERDARIQMALPGITDVVQYFSEMAKDLQASFDFRKAEYGKSVSNMVRNLMRATAIAQVDPRFKAVYDAIGGVTRYTTRKETEIRDSIHAAIEGLSTEQKNRVAEAIYIGNERQEEYTTNELARGPRDASGQQIFAGLNREEIEAYMFLRKAQRDILALRMNNLLYRESQVLRRVRDEKSAMRLSYWSQNPNMMGMNPTATRYGELLQKEADTLNRMRTIRNYYETLGDQGYVTLRRAGRIAIFAEDPTKAQDDPDRKIYDQVENWKEAGRKIREFEAAGYAGVKAYDVIKMPTTVATKLTLTEFDQIMERAGFNPSNMTDELEKIRTEIYSRSGAASYQLKREFIRGYKRTMENLLPSMITQAETYAGAFRRDIGRREAMQALKDSQMQDIDRKAYSFTVDYIDAATAPRPRNVLERASVRARQGVYIFQLAMDIGQLYLNAIGQPITVTYAFFARPEFGLKGAQPEKYFVRGASLALKTQKGTAPAEFEKFYRRAQKEGVVTPEFAKSLIEAEYRKSTRFTRFASIMQSTGEKVTRSQALAEAYLIGKEVMGLQGENLYRFMVTSVAATQGQFTPEENPGLVRMAGEVGKLAYQFQSFQQIWAETLALGLKSEIKTRKLGKATARQLGSLIAFAGVTGLPAAGLLKIILAALTGDEPDKLAKRTIKDDEIRDIVLYGFTGSPGVSIRGGVLNQTVDVEREYNPLRSIPVYTTGQQMFRGVTDIARGDALRGAESLLPRSIRGPVRAYRYAKEGVRERGGKIIVPRGRLKTGDIVGQAFNITPREVIEYYNKRRFKQFIGKKK